MRAWRGSALGPLRSDPKVRPGWSALGGAAAGSGHEGPRSRRRRAFPECGGRAASRRTVCPPSRSAGAPGSGCTTGLSCHRRRAGEAAGAAAQSRAGARMAACKRMQTAARTNPLRHAMAGFYPSSGHRRIRSSPMGDRAPNFPPDPVSVHPSRAGSPFGFSERTVSETRPS